MKINLNRVAFIFLILAVSLDLLGGRWAGYLRSPVPGIFLPDFLYLTSIFLIVSQRENYRNWFKDNSYSLLLLSVSAVGYVAIKFGMGLFYHHEKFSYAIRDGALLFFFASAPFASLAFKGVSNIKIRAVIKWSCLIYVVLYILVYLGIVTPFNSAILGNDHVRIFEFGGDLVGVVSGITYLFWSNFEGNQKISNIARILSIAPLVVNNSRGGVIAMIVVIALTIFYVTRPRLKSEILIILTGLAIGFAMSLKGVDSYYGVPSYSSNLDQSKLSKPDEVSSSALSKLIRTTNVFSSDARRRNRADKEFPILESNEYYKPFILPYGLQGLLEVDGTFAARLATWKIVLEYLIRKGMIAAGGPYGSQILYEACSNPYLPTYGAEYPGGGSLGPKCPIDSNETYFPVRDAHNFLLTLLLYNGLVGVFIFIALLLIQLKGAATLLGECKVYASIALVGYCISGLFSTFASSPFVMVPCAFMLAWMQSQNKPND